MPSKCDNVISLKQYGPTCWFNSILMAVLYSDESRKLLLKKSHIWDKNINVLNTINYILHNKYLRTDKIFKDYEYFDKIRPEIILKELYSYNKKKFIIDPDINKFGHKSALYIRKIYKLLGVKVLYLDLDFKTKHLYYSLFNNFEIVSLNTGTITLYNKIKSFSTIIKHFKNPDVVIINITEKLDDTHYPSWYKINNNNFYYNNININFFKKFSTLNNEIKNNKDIYVQDSILLANYNSNVGGHSISGITCKGDRYVYNGWTRTTIDPNIKVNSHIKDWKKMLVNDEYWYFHIPSGQIVKETDSIYPSNFPVEEFFKKNNIEIPCELMKYDWNVIKNKDFCLNPKKCILDEMNINDLCFSFNKGQREVIYVKKNRDTILTTKPDKICPEDKVLNPLTNRCIKKKTINKLPKKTLSKPDKICPEDKVLNPLTNRCIKKTTINKLPKKTLSKPDKICPEDKVLNPLTNRCNKIK
jgi:hypothetical protein